MVWIAFDRWGAVQMTQNLEGMGFTVVPFGQGFKDMSPPTKAKAPEKIDGIVAAIMALDRCIRHEQQGSVYDERGLLVF